MAIKSLLCRVLIALTFTVSVVGCESTVDPYVGTPEPYTLWGVFDSGADTQRVRVFTVDGTPGIDRSGDIDARVSSANLTTGERIEWTHRTVTYEARDSVSAPTSGDVFWADFRPREGERYRLEVMRSDGAVSTAEVTIPPPVEIEVDTRSAQTYLPVRLHTDAPNLLAVGVQYETTNLPPTLVWPVDRLAHPLVIHPVLVSYQDELNRIPGGWTFNIQMQRDYGLVRSEFERSCLVTPGAPDISLRRVKLRLIAVDSAWDPPGGVFNPEELIQPNSFSNVENGFGFIGAGQIAQLDWTPVREVRDMLGYKQTRPCNLEARPVLACMNPPIPCLGENDDDIWAVFFGRATI